MTALQNHGATHSTRCHPLNTGPPTQHGATHSTRCHPLNTGPPTQHGATHSTRGHPLNTVPPTQHGATHQRGRRTEWVISGGAGESPAGPSPYTVPGTESGHLLTNPSDRGCQRVDRHTANRRRHQPPLGWEADVSGPRLPQTSHRLRELINKLPRFLPQVIHTFERVS